MRQSVSLLTLSVVASAAITESRFVTAAGALCAANGSAAGVSQSAAAIGAMFPVVVLGTAIVESGAAIAKDALLESDATGRAVTAVNGPVLARALEAASGAGEMIEVLLTATPATVSDPEKLAAVLGAVPAAAKLARVLAANDITRYDDDGAIAISGIALIDGGEGIAGLTLAAPQAGCLARIKLDAITSGAVVLTTAEGVTFDGTNNTATFDAAGEELVLGYKSATEWEVVANVGSVALSAV